MTPGATLLTLGLLLSQTTAPSTDSTSGVLLARRDAPVVSTSSATRAFQLVQPGTEPQLEEAATAPTGCLLWMPEGQKAEAKTCLTCHDGSGAKAHLRSSHPVDLDYAQAQGLNPALRPLAEVQKRGVVVPDGQLRCVTCHSATSPWAMKVALPPGAQARPAVNPFRPETYDVAAPKTAPVAGSEVSAKPLCLACHGFD